MSVLKPYFAEIRAELLKTFRQPGFVAPSLLFPVCFYLIFGILMPHRGEFDAASWFFASYGAFGVIGPALFGFGAAMAVEREAGWLDLKQVAPMPVGAALISKMVMSLVFAVIIFVLLSLLAVTVGGVRMPASSWLASGVVLVFGTLPFCALGLVIGAYARARSAAGVVNLVYLPMSALSGLWFPLFLMPAAVQKVALLMPAYHLGQLNFIATGHASGGWMMHVLALIAFSVIFMALAARGLSRSERR